MEADVSTSLRKPPSLVTVSHQEIKSIVIQSNLSGSFSIVLFGSDSKISFTSFRHILKSYYLKSLLIPFLIIPDNAISSSNIWNLVFDIIFYPFFASLFFGRETLARLCQ